MDISGTTCVYGLIGDPVAHSISPLIHNALAQELGLDLAYVCFPVKGTKVDEAIRGAYALGISGLNVTVPHKQAALSCVQELDPVAKAVGAVNTLVRRDGQDGFKGYNTDVEGFIRETRQDSIPLTGSRAVVLGAGGAARAVCFALAKEGAVRIVIVNRTKEKAQELAGAVNAFAGRELAYILPLEDVQDTDRLLSLAGGAYLAVQTTSVGLFPHTEKTLIRDAAFFRQAVAGIDIIYNPDETQFMKECRAAGKPAFNGLAMLLYQGIASFELWTGKQVPDTAARQVYAMMKEEMARRREADNTDPGRRLI